MKTNIISLRFLALSFFAMLFVVSGCKKDFDQPPGDELPVLTANQTIAGLKAIHTLGNAADSISEDWIIKATVIADDESGNFYKQLIIQDSTGGIEIRLDANGLYNDYPVGREVYVQCKGLYVGDYSGSYQITANANNDRIAGPLISDYILGGKRDQFVTPQLLTIDQLGEEHVYTLIELDSVEFGSGDAGATYADMVGATYGNLTIQDCASGSATMRTSNYANFGGATTPTGRGTLHAVFSLFGTTKQLYIRDTDDLAFNGPRCGGGGTSGDLMNISDVRALYQGADVQAPSNKKIKGFVISDKDNGNGVAQNMVMQDATAGIVVRFDAPHNFAVGDEVEIGISGLYITEFNGLMQVDAVPIGNASVLSTGNALVPSSTTTISDIVNNFADYESELVKVTGVTLTGSTFGGGATADDGTSIDLFTWSGASFANDPIPSGTVELVAIVSEYNTPQLMLRSGLDVTGGTQITYDMNETFDGATEFAPITLPGWLVHQEVGTQDWVGRIFSGNSYAEMGAFGSGEASVITWLVTPSLDLTTANKNFAFDTELAFHNSDCLSVWISTDFNGTDVAAATWLPLSATLAGSANSNYEWVNSGTLDLSTYTGNTAYVAFKYTGGDPSATTTFHVDNVKLWDQ